MEMLSVRHGDKYQGKYVAMPTFNDMTVIASGNKAVEVIKRAKKKGFTSPVILYIPTGDAIHLY